MESNLGVTTLAVAQQLVARFPSLTLLREVANSTLERREYSLLPIGAIEPELYALRLAEVVLALGINIEKITGIDEVRVNAGDFTSPFITTHTEFFDAVCVAMEGSETIRVTIMGPTFLIPEHVLLERSRRKAGRNFTKELQDKLDQFTLARLVIRNSRERFLKTIDPYVASISDRNAVVEQMLENLDHLRRGLIFPRLQFRCVDTGFSNIPHLFDSVGLLGSRRSADTAVDGGWLLNDPAVLGLEKEKYDRVFNASQSQSEAYEKMEQFLWDLL
ncbi:hypothetical protein IRT45_05860 [Nocardia sp. BSTN01]|uniref:hypothetical protein n=1 Tax=Nocardia sp. BSTN01 TaxID=2783665 RepID=UPI00188FB96E|nr:hypothetical protein [Nocardia sp. BSTN01]MBF4996679.1 hypothetical protein [Nocardia sp. BSTN01]